MNVKVMICNVNVTVCSDPFYSIDVHNEMKNTTTRIAVEIKNLPDFEFDWSDCTSQRSIQSLTEEDILPNESDGVILYNRMVSYVKKFLVAQFDTLKHLRKGDGPTDCVPKSVVIPMKLLFRDEKYTDENIMILHQLINDAKLTGYPQVCNYA